MRSFDTALHAAVEPARMRTALLAFFAGIAVLLTLAGAYGRVALAARMRRTEMGVRMVMGVTPRRVLGHLTGEVVVVSVIGAIIGALVANAGAGVLRSLLFGVSASDWVLGSAAAMFFCATLAAAVIPAWKISRMQPRDALDRSG